MRHVLIALVIYGQSVMSVQAGPRDISNDVEAHILLQDRGAAMRVMVVGISAVANKPTAAEEPSTETQNTTTSMVGGRTCPDIGHVPISNTAMDTSFINRVGYCPSASRNDTVNFCSCVATTASQGLAGFHVITTEELLATSSQLREINLAAKMEELTSEYNQFYDELLFALGEPTMRSRALEMQNSDCFPGGSSNRLAGYFSNLGNPSNPERTCNTPNARQTINEVFFAYGRDESDYIRDSKPTMFRPTAGANFIQHLENTSRIRYSTFLGHLDDGVNLTNPNSALTSSTPNEGQIDTISQQLLSYIQAFRTNPASLPALNTPAFGEIVTSLMTIPSFELQNDHTPEQLPAMVQKIFSDIVTKSGVSGTSALSKDHIKTAIQNHVGGNLAAMGERCEEMKRLLNDMCELASITKVSETAGKFSPSPLESNTNVARQYAQAQSRMRGLQSDGTATIAANADPLSMAATPEMVNDYQDFLFGIDAWSCFNSTETFEGAYNSESLAMMRTVRQQDDKAEPLIIGGTSTNPTATGGGGGGQGGQERQNRENYFNSLANQQRDQIESIRRSGVSIRNSNQSDSDDVADTREVPLPESESTQGTSSIPFAPVAAAPTSSSVDFLPELGGSSDDGAKANSEIPLVAKGDGNTAAADGTAELRRQIEEMRASMTKRQQQLEAMMQERNRQALTGADTSEIDALMARRREELLDLDRQLQAKRTSLAAATPAAATIPQRAPAALSDDSSSSAPVGASSSKAARSSGGTTSSGASSSSSGSTGSSGFGLNSSSAGVSAAGTGLSSLGVVSDYTGPQLFLNGQKFNTEGKFIIDFNRLATATPVALKEIFRLSDGQPIFVRFEDNSLKEYVPQAVDGGAVVFIPRADSANRAVASKGEIEVAPVGEESTEGRTKHSDLVEILDTNVVRE